jgi:acetyl esterase/lipase
VGVKNWMFNSTYGKAYGRFFKPPPSANKQVGILLFGGSEGGLNYKVVLAASLLAARGYPTLALAYFQGPGVPDVDNKKLPQALFKIPLENFESALDWLTKPEQGVRPDRIFVSGASRGSEAALLLGIHSNPDRVYGVIGNVPSDEVVCSPNSTSESAWQLNGASIRCTAQRKHVGEASIPVERIGGPLFLNCGEEDKVWDSCVFMDSIIKRLNGAPPANRPVVHRGLGAGHGVGSLVPYQPTIPTAVAAGAPLIANQVEDAKLWPKLLDFLRSRS